MRNRGKKPSIVEARNGRWAVLDGEGRAVCLVRDKKTADDLLACTFDGSRFVRRTAVARAVELRGLQQNVPPNGRKAAAAASQNTFDQGHSASWAVLAGWRVLDYWTPTKRTPWSVALAGNMP